MNMEMEDDATLLMHCYNFQNVFPEWAKQIRAEIISDLREEGASREYLMKIDKAAMHKSWFGSGLHKMMTRLKEMKILGDGK